jgi:hypothetical protein
MPFVGVLAASVLYGCFSNKSTVKSKPNAMILKCKSPVIEAPSLTFALRPTA